LIGYFPLEEDVQMETKPEKVQYIGIGMLVSGISNVLAGCGLTGIILLGTLGIGIICAPLTLIPAILGGFEIFYATKILKNPPDAIKVQYLQYLSYAEVASIIWGNVISAVVGVVVIIFFNEPEVGDYFRDLEASAPAM
jgi:hypothetical protein